MDEGSMSIKIKTLTGKELNIHVDHSTTVKELKSKVHDKDGIPPDQ